MSERKPLLLLEDILSSTEKILIYTSGMTLDAFLSDEKTKDAVIRNFEIIGEAANRLPNTIKTEYTSVDWDRLRGFRNRIVHDYMGIDYYIVWQIIHTYVSTLKNEIANIINERSA